MPETYLFCGNCRAYLPMSSMVEGKDGLYRCSDCKGKK